jgi:hypothetical protein
MAQRLAVAADRGHALRHDPAIAQEGERRRGKGLRQFDIDLADFVERDAIRGVEDMGDPALELGVEGGGAGGYDPQRRPIEIDQGGVDGVHAGSGH